MMQSVSKRLLRRLALPALLLPAVLTFAGCAATVDKNRDAPPLKVPLDASKNLVFTLTGSQGSTSSSDWEAFKGAWFGACKAQTEQAGAIFASTATPPRPGTGIGTSIVIHVNDYRYLSAGARYGFGFFTGNAFVDSKVQFRDLSSGNLIGERVYNTSSSAWQGVFSAMTEKQLDAICSEIIGEIRAK
ncbi:hypothetical protein BH09PSE6_BH09PSE6_18240 [soil metagenome]